MYRTQKLETTSFFTWTQFSYRPPGPPRDWERGGGKAIALSSLAVGFFIYTGTLVWYQPDRIESWKKLCWRDNKFPFF